VLSIWYTEIIALCLHFLISEKPRQIAGAFYLVANIVLGLKATKIDVVPPIAAFYVFASI